MSDVQMCNKSHCTEIPTKDIKHSAVFLVDLLTAELSDVLNKHVRYYFQKLGIQK